MLGGPEVAIEAVRQRAGTIFDPTIAETFVGHAPSYWETASLGDPRKGVLEAEPVPHQVISEDQLPQVATVFGDIADLKTPFTHGHSAGMAHLAHAAGVELGLDPNSLLQLQVASLLHDIGRIAIPDVVWEKPGPLTTAEWEQVRLHPYHSERIMSCPRSLSQWHPLPDCITSAWTVPATTAGAKPRRYPSRLAFSRLLMFSKR